MMDEGGSEVEARFRVEEGGFEMFGWVVVDAALWARVASSSARWLAKVFWDMSIRRTFGVVLLFETAC